MKKSMGRSGGVIPYSPKPFYYMEVHGCVYCKTTIFETEPLVFIG